MIPDVIDVWHNFLPQFLTFLSFLGLEELKHISVGKGSIELNSIAHGAANDEDADAEAEDSNKEDYVVIKEGADEAMRKELKCQHEPQIHVEFINNLL